MPDDSLCGFLSRKYIYSGQNIFFMQKEIARIEAPSRWRAASMHQESGMTGIRIEDIESVRFSAPDLLQMHAFLLEFGLADTQAGKDGVLHMRGTGDAPFLHETVEGPPAFLSIALRAASLSDLEALAQAEQKPVEPLDAPGGGSVVQLR